MQIIPVSSKQIDFVSYDDHTSQIVIHFHTGVVQVCTDVGQDQVRRLLVSDKPYDFIMNLTGTAEATQNAQQA